MKRIMKFIKIVLYHLDIRWIFIPVNEKLMPSVCTMAQGKYLSQKK